MCICQARQRRAWGRRRKPGAQRGRGAAPVRGQGHAQLVERDRHLRALAGLAGRAASIRSARLHAPREMSEAPESRTDV